MIKKTESQEIQELHSQLKVMKSLSSNAIRNRLAIVKAQVSKNLLGIPGMEELDKLLAGNVAAQRASQNSVGMAADASFPQKQ